MRLPLPLGFLLSFLIVGNLPANPIFSCSFNGGALNTTGCYSLANFSANLTQTVDWQAAYGNVDTAAVDQHPTMYNPVQNGGPWMASAAAGGLQVGATLFNPSSGAYPITRYDNFATGSPGLANWTNWVGTFDTPPDAGAGFPGDHLLAIQVGQLELQFDRGVSGALFRISTPTSADVDATVAAYSQINPLVGDIPIMTYRIVSTGGGGTCYGLADAPCNTAPYIGIEGGSLNIRSLVISTTNQGVLVDTLFLDVPAPEPGTFALTGLVGLLAILGRRRMLSDRRP